MFGEASSSQAPSASKRLFGSCLLILLTARVFSAYVPHFQGIWEMECLSPSTGMFDRFLCMLGALGMASVMSSLPARSYISFFQILKSRSIIPISLNCLNYFVNHHVGFRNILIAFL